MLGWRLQGGWASAKVLLVELGAARLLGLLVRN